VAGDAAGDCELGEFGEGEAAHAADGGDAECQEGDECGEWVPGEAEYEAPVREDCQCLRVAGAAGDAVDDYLGT
jgi:hypothetical protein